MAKQSIETGPPSQPNCATLHARDNTPDPITAVIIWAMHVQIVPGWVHLPTTRLQMLGLFKSLEGKSKGLTNFQKWITEEPNLLPVRMSRSSSEQEASVSAREWWTAISFMILIKVKRVVDRHHQFLNEVCNIERRSRLGRSKHQPYWNFWHSNLELWLARGSRVDRMRASRILFPFSVWFESVSNIFCTSKGGKESTSMGLHIHLLAYVCRVRVQLRVRTICEA